MPKRYIDADALTLKIDDWRVDLEATYGKNDDYVEALRDALDIIKDAPTADVVERKTGKWEIYVISPFDGEGCRCSECKYEGVPYWNFCPTCGADMRGDGNDN